MKAEIILEAVAESAKYVLRGMSLEVAYITFPTFDTADSAFDYVSNNHLDGLVAVERVQVQPVPGRVVIEVTHHEAVVLSKMVTHNEYLQDLAKALREAGV